MTDTVTAATPAATALPPPSLVALVEQMSAGEKECRRDFAEAAADEILAYGAVVGAAVELFQRRDRCMDYARALIREYEQAGRAFPSGQVFIARELAAGKGRFDRSWHAPAGGLWLTLVLVNTLLPQHGRFYSLAVGVACAETLHSFGVPAKIKWVNDILLDNRKLAGTLIETDRGLHGAEEYVLIGIGINVNNDSFPPELHGLAGAMKDYLGREIPLEVVAARLLSKLRWNIGLLHYAEARQLAEEGDTGEPPLNHPLLQSWRQLSDTIGRRVMFGFDIQRRPQYEAVVEDIEPSGGLVLRHLADGAQIIEHAGEIIYLD
ncbi:biotin--[acetyl-CoA-carboxylase] ligase [Desulfurivibrio alkaliphilus]|uniref:Biotin/acetyl-CoA-carboxylase ligase n=1 Tax=Desulfurivibrio alkaliphilus (strain DSM 19089 / UNIQEM U267 / AHT2) TaxID=589865 RepID=D6Z014_DESAT|nr:biotin--[acetyl-CoA-carboxylase] ligase [Desulfurivibrio alkaliphilus]ADH85171.1 biotin/acetyl-CoA-carboxylase ligase [Desulfurivibrio alkaliphilus AHT 2]